MYELITFIVIIFIILPVIGLFFYFLFFVRVPTEIALKKFDDELFLIEQNDEHLAYVDEMKEAGFEHLGSTVVHRSNGYDTALSFFVQEPSGRVGLVATVPGSLDDVTYIEVAQGYEDGSSLVASNTDRSLYYPFSELGMYYRYTHVLRVATLVAMHEELRKTYKAQVPVRHPKREKGLEMIEGSIRQVSDRLCEKRLCCPAIDADGFRRLSARGALLMLVKKVLPGQAIWEKLFAGSGTHAEMHA